MAHLEWEWKRLADFTTDPSPFGHRLSDVWF
jgi:hypothetical protein